MTSNNIPSTPLGNQTSLPVPSYLTPEQERLAKQVAWVAGGFASLAYIPAPFSLVGFAFSLYQAFGSPNPPRANTPPTEGSSEISPNRGALKHTTSGASMNTVESVKQWREGVQASSPEEPTEPDVLSIDGTTTHTAPHEENSIDDLDTSLMGSDNEWRLVQNPTSEKRG